MRALILLVMVAFAGLASVLPTTSHALVVDAVRDPVYSGQFTARVGPNAYYRVGQGVVNGADLHTVIPVATPANPTAASAELAAVVRARSPSTSFAESRATALVRSTPAGALKPILEITNGATAVVAAGYVGWKIGGGLCAHLTFCSSGPDDASVITTVDSTGPPPEALFIEPKLALKDPWSDCCTSWSGFESLPTGIYDGGNRSTSGGNNSLTPFQPDPSCTNGEPRTVSGCLIMNAFFAGTAIREKATPEYTNCNVTKMIGELPASVQSSPWVRLDIPGPTGATSCGRTFITTSVTHSVAYRPWPAGQLLPQLRPAPMGQAPTVPTATLDGPALRNRLASDPALAVAIAMEAVAPGSTANLTTTKSTSTPKRPLMRTSMA